MAGLGIDTQPRSPDEAPPVSVESTSVDALAAAPVVPMDGGLDQAGIDALLAQIGLGDGAKPPADAGSATVSPVAAAVAAQAAAVGSSSGGLDQGGIDALLAQMGMGEAPASDEGTNSAPAAASDSDEAADEGDALSDGSAAAALPQPSGAGLDQGDIDNLMAQLQSQEGTGEVSRGPRTGTITHEDLAAIVARHGSEQGQESSGTGAIGQSDIDALVAQLDNATSSGRGGSADLTRDGDTIDALLEQATRRVKIGDALSLSQFAGAPPASALPEGAALMSPEELRGTRILMVAAVVFLMTCTFAMVLVIASLNRLTGELAHGRGVEAGPSDDIARDFEVAETWLRDEDPAIVQRGLLFLDDIRRQHRGQEEAVGLRLAGHYRQVGAHAEAVTEFTRLDQRAVGLREDPAFHLDFADSLMEIGSYERARQQAYIVVANRAWFLSPQDPSGEARDPLLLARHREHVQRARVLIGRIFAAELARADGPREVRP